MSPTDNTRLRRISSRQNQLVKQLRHAFTHAALTEQGDCAIESVRVVEEALRSKLQFRVVVFAESATRRAERYLSQLGPEVEAVVLPDEIFNSAVATEAPQGIAALVRLPLFSLEGALERQPALIVASAGLQDPGNLGTVLRSLEAFGGTALLHGAGSVSYLNAKVVRAAAGSLFRMPVVHGQLEDMLPRLRERGVRMLGTSSHEGTPLRSADLRGPVAVFIGNEGAGMSPELLAQMDGMVTIPHTQNVESLNAGVAASVVLYEAFVQRAG